jgi:hypothetical protein
LEKEKELTEQVMKINSYIPISFYVRMITGFVLIVLMPVLFTVLAIVASLLVIGMILYNLFIIILYY